GERVVVVAIAVVAVDVGSEA
ncbi:hypothetical protein Tco_0467090, partial [Tanacetum coccineum]